jgi:hydrogenase/urease accessory protein HupE
MHRILKNFVVLAGVALLALMPVLLSAQRAEAHNGVESYVYLDIFDDTIAGNIQYPVTDLNELLGLSIPQDRQGAFDAMTANLDTLHAYTNQHFAIGSGAQAWGIEYTGYRVLEISAGTYAILEFEVADQLSPVPRQFTVDYSAIITEKDDRTALLLIANDWATGTFRNEGDSLLRYTADNTSQVVDLEDASWLKGMSAVIGLGMEHIRIGSDHILFVLALVLPSVLVFRRSEGWLPARTFGRSLWRVLKIVTMFTIAHSITLALGGLEIVELPPRFVEAVIAISIALAALHNIRPMFVNKEWLLAFGFGLFHGFGFAGLLSELGLDRSNRIASLLGFNIGIEIGQMVIILLIFPALFLLRRTRPYLGIMYAGSVALALVALGWALERVFDLESSVSTLVDPVLDWPRSLYIAIALTAIAAVMYWYERSNEELLPLPADEPERIEEPAVTV